MEVGGFEKLVARKEKKEMLLNELGVRDWVDRGEIAGGNKIGKSRRNIKIEGIEK